MHLQSITFSLQIVHGDWILQRSKYAVIILPLVEKSTKFSPRCNYLTQNILFVDYNNICRNVNSRPIKWWYFATIYSRKPKIILPTFQEILNIIKASFWRKSMIHFWKHFREKLMALSSIVPLSIISKRLLLICNSWEEVSAEKDTFVGSVFCWKLA